MKSNKDYSEEENVKNIYNLLEKSEISNFSDGVSNLGDEVISGDDIPEVDDLVFPGSLEFRMDAMKMNLFMELKAPINSNNKITIHNIREGLEKYTAFCNRQVNWQVVNDIYHRVMLENELVEEIKIASGLKADFHIPEHIILKDELTPDFRPEIIDDKRVNFHTIRSFIQVKKEEFLGDVIPENPGVKGRNLNGDEIPAPIKVINTLKPGKNIKLIANKLYSEIDGAFKINEDVLEVDDLLEIAEDIDYSTGDIDFIGDLTVGKSIREGFAVKITKSLLVKDTIEPTNILCGHNLIAGHGIIGSNKYSIECGGVINAHYLEYVKIKSHGDINVNKSVLGSELCTQGKIIVSEKGSIIAGECSAQNGIFAGNIGNSTGIKTHVNVGSDFFIEDKLEKIKETRELISGEMLKLQDYLKSPITREERDKTRYLFLSLKNRLSTLNTYTTELLKKLDKNDKATIKVPGTVYPGTKVTICHLSFFVLEEMKSVKFLLDKKYGRVIWQPL